jgi:hypothetical protein
MYVIIGWIAVEIAIGHSRQQADRTGALHDLASTPVGGILLWPLVILVRGHDALVAVRSPVLRARP